MICRHRPRKRGLVCVASAGSASTTACTVLPAFLAGHPQIYERTPQKTRQCPSRRPV